VIELSVAEARRLNHHYIGTEHLLLGLVRESEGIAAGVLESLGVQLDQVRSEVIRTLNQSAASSQSFQRRQRARPVAPRGLEPVPEDWERALAIVAHPDDLEFGASSAVAKWTAAGKQVAYLLASRGEAGIDSLAPEQAAPLREAEERESGRLVGVETVEFLGHRDGVIEHGLGLRRDLARAIRRQRPEAIITVDFELTWPGGKLNQADHRSVGLEACDAARDAGNRWIFPELGEEGLETWSGTRWILVSGVAQPTHACDVGDDLSSHLDADAASQQIVELGQDERREDTRVVTVDRRERSRVVVLQAVVVRQQSAGVDEDQSSPNPSRSSSTLPARFP